jgi:predicted MFS family arabinose efflux permease
MVAKRTKAGDRPVKQGKYQMSDATRPIGSTKPVLQTFTPSYVRYALWMLLIVYTLNFIDRQIIAILGAQIKADLEISDTQFGLLVGIAFAFFYTILGIPIARVAERGNRVTIISIAVVIWSGFTAMCGIAQNFTQLLLARIGVGVGEAGCTPPAHSLISDYVPAEKRASAIAFYSLGVPIGSALGLILGGWIATKVDWRTAFFAVGVPGVIVGLLVMFTLKEPRKALAAATAASASTAPTFGEAIKTLGKKKAYWWAVGAATTISFLGYGHATFLPQFLGRVHKMPLQDIGLALGIMTFISGILGTLLGGWAADRAAKADTRAYMTIPAVAFLAGTPFFLFGMFAQTPTLALLGLAVPTLMNSVWYGPVYASVQGLAPPRMRATAVALMLFLVNMIGLGAGPTLIGLLSDIFANQQFVAPNAGVAYAEFCAKGAATAKDAACMAASAEGLRWSLVASASVGVIALLCFWMAQKTIREDLAETAAEAAFDGAKTA